MANNSRLLALPGGQDANLLSRFMKLMLRQLSADWQTRWGHPLALVETFVDPRLYQGTAYQVSGWAHLGKSAGWTRDADDFYAPHDAPKQIWVRELTKQACVQLRAPQLPAPWATVEAAAPRRCTATAAHLGSLRDLVAAEVAEWRRAQALAYPLPGLVSLMVMAAAQGVVRGPQDLADYADTLSQAQLRALRFRAKPGQPRVIRAPKKTTFSRVLHQVDDELLERALLRWQAQILGPRQDRLVIVDGKAVRHGGVEIVHAVNGHGRFLGSRVTAAKSNEIPAARQLLRGQDLLGRIVLGDALHTQVATAQQILFEGGGDYLLTVKGNQPTLQQTLASLFTQQAFSPSAHGAHTGPQTGAQPGPVGDSVSGVPGSDPQPSGLSGRPPSGAAGDARQAGRLLGPGSGLSDQQPDLGPTPS